MLRRTLSTAVFVLLSLAGTSANAFIVDLHATINGEAQGSAQAGLPGRGLAGLLYDTDSNILSWALGWVLLSGEATGVHFHVGAPGASGPVKVDIMENSTPNLTINRPSGTGLLIGSYDLDGLGFPDVVMSEHDLLVGELWYISITSAQFPNGEIRGQVQGGNGGGGPTPIPEPGMLALLGIALAGLALVARHRRRHAL